MGARLSRNMRSISRSSITLICIVGPTASGKSSLAIELARKYNGEIVSADSRQVYTSLDIGTGKVTKAERRRVQHHLLDIFKPGTQCTLARFKKLADTAIFDIYSRGKVPIVVGGSSLYITAVIDNYVIPPVKKNARLRRELERTPPEELLRELQSIDPETFARIDTHNTRRVIRAIEVTRLSGTPFSQQQQRGNDVYQTLMFGISCDREKLYKKIDERVESRLRRGMIREVAKLKEQGVSSHWLESLGLEYRFINIYLSGRDHSKKMRDEMVQRLKFAIHDFARRQLVWLRRDQRIVWVHSQKEVERYVKKARTAVQALRS